MRKQSFGKGAIAFLTWDHILPPRLILLIASMTFCLFFFMNSLFFSYPFMYTLTAAFDMTLFFACTYILICAVYVGYFRYAVQKHGITKASSQLAETAKLAHDADKAIFEQDHPFRIDYNYVISLIGTYLFVTFLVYLLLPKIYEAPVSGGTAITVAVLIILKIRILTLIADAVTVTSNQRDYFLPLIVAAALAEAMALAIKLPFETPLIEELAKHIPDTFDIGWATLLGPILLVTLVGIFVMYLSRKKKFQEEYNSTTKLGALVTIIIMAFTLAGINYVSAFIPTAANERPAYSLLYILRETVVVAVLAGLLFTLKFNLKKLHKFFRKRRPPEPFKVLTGTIIGSSSFGLKHDIFGRYAVEQTWNFYLLKAGKKTYNVRIPQRSKVYIGESQIVVGDKIEVWGYMMVNKRLNEEKVEVHHLNSLYIRRIKDSPLREVAETQSR